MNINQTFPSKWIKASDLQGRTFKLTIHDVTLEQFQDGTQKPAVWFVGREKAMILNKTNAETIAAMYGEETDTWKGRELEVFSMKVQGPNGIVDGIRVRIPDAPQPQQLETPQAAAQSFQQPQQPTQQPQMNGTTETDLDDDIPF